MAARILAVIDRGSHGTEEQHRDLLEFCVGVRLQFGSMDLVLRGSAVGCAVDVSQVSASRDGNGSAKKLPDPQRYLRSLIRTGVQVWADDTDLAELGQSDGPLLDGVVSADADTLALRWQEYEEVWYL